MRGVIPPLLTPLTPEGELDCPALERLIEHVIGGGVHALFTLGTMGEAAGLALSVRREVLQQVVRAVGDRVPVLVGVSDPAIQTTLDLAHHAAEHGAHAVVVSPPSYLPPEPEELRRYYEILLDRLPLPCVLYDIPPLTKVALDEETLTALSSRSGILGLKDSSGELERTLTACRIGRGASPPWSVWVGSDELMADAVLGGADGAVPGGANLYPRLFVAAFEAADRGDLAAVERLRARIVGLSRLYGVGRGASAATKGAKMALHLMEITGPDMAPPFGRLDAKGEGAVRAILDDIGPDDGWTVG